MGMPAAKALRHTIQKHGESKTAGKTITSSTADLLQNTHPIKATEFNTKTRSSDFRNPQILRTCIGLTAQTSPTSIDLRSVKAVITQFAGPCCVGHWKQHGPMQLPLVLVQFCSLRLSTALQSSHLLGATKFSPRPPHAMRQP